MNFIISYTVGVHEGLGMVVITTFLHPAKIIRVVSRGSILNSLKTWFFLKEIKIRCHSLKEFKIPNEFLII